MTKTRTTQPDLPENLRSVGYPIATLDLDTGAHGQSRAKHKVMLDSPTSGIVRVIDEAGDWWEFDPQRHAHIAAEVEPERIAQ